MPPINPTVTTPVADFAIDNAGKPYLFAATAMKVRSAPNNSPSSVMIQAGKVNDVVYIDEGTSFKWLDASWETGKELKDMKVGDVDRVYVLIAGPDNVTPAGWVCLYEEYKTKDPDETLYVNWCGLTANNPPTTNEVDSLQVQLNKDKTARDAFLATVGKSTGGNGDSVSTGGGGSTVKKAAFGAGGFLIAMLIVGIIMGNKMTRVPQDQQQAFLTQVAPAAKSICPQYGLDPAQCIGEAIEGSSWGRFAIGYNWWGLVGVGDAGYYSLLRPVRTYEQAGGGWTSQQEQLAKFSCPAAAVRAWCEVTRGAT